MDLLLIIVIYISDYCRRKQCTKLCVCVLLVCTNYLHSIYYCKTKIMMYIFVLLIVYISAFFILHKKCVFVSRQSVNVI